VGGLTVARLGGRALAGGQWGGPFMLKGVTRVDDAKAGRRRGGDRDLRVQPRRQRPGRHPGRDRVLPPIAAAVGDQVEVVLDGGIRRGGDVVKAVALGARR